MSGIVHVLTYEEDAFGCSVRFVPTERRVIAKDAVGSPDRPVEEWRRMDGYFFFGCRIILC